MTHGYTSSVARRSALRPAWPDPLADLHAGYLARAQAPPAQLARYLLEHEAGERRRAAAWRVTTRGLQPHDQAEVLQEGVVKFLQDFAAGKGPRYSDDRGVGAFGAWLFAVWRRRFLTVVCAHRRARGRLTPLTPAVEDDLAAPGADVCPFAAEDAGRVRAALEAELATLAPKYNHPELWLACLRGDRPWLDLARTCGVEPSYVSRLWPRLLRRMQRRLGVIESVGDGVQKKLR